jgi:hypothetical protein
MLGLNDSDQVFGSVDRRLIGYVAFVSFMNVEDWYPIWRLDLAYQTAALAQFKDNASVARDARLHSRV